MKIEKVAIIGANGNVGPSILKALIDTPNFKVSVLTRASSKSSYPSTVDVVKIDDDLPHDQLLKALTGHDALVLAFSGTQKDNSIKLADAAFEAGVKYIIPADFGSCDSSDPRSLDLIPLYVNKKDVRDHLVKLSGKTRSDGSTISWTSLITGHFFDYGLKTDLLNFHINKGTVTVFDGGDYKHALTTLATVGLATAQILQKTDNPRLKNKLVFMQGIQTTQNDLVTVVEKVTGKRLEVQKVSSDEFIRKYKTKLEKDPGNAEFTEELVSVEGIVNTNWDSKGDSYVNDLLDLPKKSLEDMVREALS